jgi:hypothetical protein
VPVSDGILIDEILHDILDAEMDLGLTGQVEFIDLTNYAKKKLVDGDLLLVKAINGHVLHMGNDRPLSRNVCTSLVKGSYMMNHLGIIRVKDSIPELKSNYLTMTVAERAAGFIFEDDPARTESQQQDVAFHCIK